MKERYIVIHEELTKWADECPYSGLISDDQINDMAIQALENEVSGDTDRRLDEYRGK